MTFTLRAYRPADADALVALAVETFAPFMSAYRAHVGPVVFRHERTDWEGEYRRRIPAMHEPDAGRHVVVAESQPDGALLGFVGYEFDAERRHGTLELVYVAESARRTGAGAAMCRHAVDALDALGAEVVDVGTGGDLFHAPARALYESLGFVAVPVVHYVRDLTSTPTSTPISTQA